MKPIKNDLRIIDLLQRSVATGNPCLDLSYERLGDIGVLFLTRMKDLSHLTELNLSWNELTNKGIEALAQCRSLNGLTTLILDANEIEYDQVLMIDADNVLTVKSNPLDFGQ